MASAGVDGTGILSDFTFTRSPEDDDQQQRDQEVSMLGAPGFIRSVTSWGGQSWYYRQAHIRERRSAIKVAGFYQFKTTRRADSAAEAGRLAACITGRTTAARRLSARTASTTAQGRNDSTSDRPAPLTSCASATKRLREDRREHLRVPTYEKSTLRNQTTGR